MEPWNKRVSDEVIVESYKRLGNVHKVADEIGMSHASVHERLVRLKMNLPEGHGRGRFSAAERSILQERYLEYRNTGRVKELAKELGRTVPFLARQARALGLTSYSHPRPSISVWKYMTEPEARIIWQRFKDGSKGVGAFCKAQGFDDLGFSRTMQKYFGDEWEHVLETKVPAQSWYQYGRALEYSTRNHLRKLGYFVLRSPASKSPIDLVAIRPGLVLFVQCKRGGVLEPKEWNAILEVARSVNAVALLALHKNSGRGIQYWKLLDFKDGSKRRQPYEPYDPDPVLKPTGLFDEQQSV